MYSAKAGIGNYMQIHCKRKMLPLLFINLSVSRWEHNGKENREWGTM